MFRSLSGASSATPGKHASSLTRLGFYDVLFFCNFPLQHCRVQTASFHSVLGAGFVWLCHSSPIQEEFWVSGSQDERYFKRFALNHARTVDPCLYAAAHFSRIMVFCRRQFRKFEFGTVACFFCMRNGPLLIAPLVESVSSLTRLGFI